MIYIGMHFERRNWEKWNTAFRVSLKLTVIAEKKPFLFFNREKLRQNVAAEVEKSRGNIGTV